MVVRTRKQDHEKSTISLTRSQDEKRVRLSIGTDAHHEKSNMWTSKEKKGGRQDDFFFFLRSFIAQNCL